jgi:hypothetical protein
MTPKRCLQSLLVSEIQNYVANYQIPLIKLTNSVRHQWLMSVNASYLVDRNQEYGGLRPAWANTLWDPSWKTPNIKQGWLCGSSDSAPGLQVRPWVQSPVLSKKKLTNSENICYWFGQKKSFISLPVLLMETIPLIKAAVHRIFIQVLVFMLTHGL